MKKIEAIIRHHKVDEIKEALVKLGVHGMTISEVRGYGRQKGHTETYRGTEYSVDFVPKTLMTVVVDAPQLQGALNAIIAAARTGQVGDGKIIVTDVADVIRIRTGETGATAI